MKLDIAQHANFERLQVQPRPGRTLIVGSRVYGKKEDRRKRYADAVGVDMQAGDGVDVVFDLELPEARTALLPKFDHVECLSVLEHVQRPWLMAETIEALMNPGATLLVYVPFVWRQHGYPSDYWRLTPQALDIIFPNIDWQAKALLADQVRSATEALPQTTFNRNRYMIRTETAGFGVRR